jgi:hypothetical protein
MHYWQAFTDSESTYVFDGNSMTHISENPAAVLRDMLEKSSPTGKLHPDIYEQLDRMERYLDEPVSEEEARRIISGQNAVASRDN